MTLNGAMRASSTGMHAERLRMDLISSNIANANSVRTPNQDAYRRQMMILSGGDDGVKVQRIIQDEAPLRAVTEPEHPFADDQGLVYYSNVDPIMEMVNMVSATRSYEANIAAFNSAKGMIRAALTIGRV